MNFFTCHVSDEAQVMLNRTVHSGFINEGPRVKEFETALADRGLLNPVAVNSGTSALHLAVEIAVREFKRNHPHITKPKVLLPAQTFIATGLAILMAGAVPVFVDIERSTGNMSPKSVKEAFDTYEGVAAVLPVHWAGAPANTLALSAAVSGEAFIIEDAAHAFGAEYGGRPVGACLVADFTCFSFQAIKGLTTADGGAVCSRYFEDRLRKLRWFGIDRKEKVGWLGEREADIEEVGYKYNMNDVAASIGIGNLLDFDARLKQRKANAYLYDSSLKNIAGLELLTYNDNSSHWLFTVLVEKRNEFIEKMNAAKIPVSIVHRGIDRNSVFGDYRTDLVNQRYWDAHQIAVPVHEDLTDEDKKLIIETIRSGW